jgi:phosphohistidine phosphatase
MMVSSRRLYFLRHGLADHPDFQGDDDRRPLTRDGEVRLRRQAGFLDALDLDLDVILASPLTRAAQTAAIVAGRLGLADRVLEEPRLGLGFDVAALAAILADLPAGQRRIMLVGHEPGLSTVVGAITGGSDVVFKKGGLARVDLGDGGELHGRLVWLLPPRVMQG